MLHSVKKLKSWEVVISNNKAMDCQIGHKLLKNHPEQLCIKQLQIHKRIIHQLDRQVFLGLVETPEDTQLSKDLAQD